MLTFRTLGISLLFSIILTSSFVVAQDDSIRKDLEAAYAKRDKAIRDKDLDAFNSLMASDYKSKSKDGVTNSLEENSAKMAKNFADKNVKEVICITKIDDINLGKAGNEVVVDASQTLTMNTTISGQPHQFQVQAKIRETWVRTDAGWRVRYTENMDTSATEVGPVVWSSYVSAEGRYSVSMPGQPALTTDQSNADLVSYRVMSISMPFVFLVQYSDLGPEQVFDTKDWAKSVTSSGSNILTSKAATLGGYPAYQLIDVKKGSSGPEMVTDSRAVNLGRRLYFLIYGYPKGTDSDAAKANAAKFFDSFKITQLGPEKP